jgi:hypothetical protein
MGAAAGNPNRLSRSDFRGTRRGTNHALTNRGEILSCILGYVKKRFSELSFPLGKIQVPRVD